MSYRKRPLRHMPPETRKVARLINELESATRRLKDLIPGIQSMELWERADQTRQRAFAKEE